MQKYIVEVDNLVKVKGKKEILHNISFNLEKGEIVGLLGANGAGKTTILKCISNMYQYTGSIKIFGNELKDNFEKVISKVGMIIEEPVFYPELTGRENLNLISKYYDDINKNDIEKIVDMFSMQDYINKKVKIYSLGMKQRLGLAMTLINSPEIIILDEPMNGLDPDGIYNLRVLLKKLASEEGKTVLISSHILSEMQQLCDRVMFIKKGTIVSIEETGDELENRYLELMKGEEH